MDIITRRAAHAAGLAKFYTGRPCIYGHDSPRFVSSGACVACIRGYSRNYARAKNGATVRLILEGLHPDDAAALRDMAAAMRATRDAVAPVVSIDAVRAATLGPDATDAPPGYVAPPFVAHPGRTA